MNYEKILEELRRDAEYRKSTTEFLPNPPKINLPLGFDIEFVGGPKDGVVYAIQASRNGRPPLTYEVPIVPKATWGWERQDEIPPAAAVMKRGLYRLEKRYDDEYFYSYYGEY